MRITDILSESEFSTLLESMKENSIESEAPLVNLDEHPVEEADTAPKTFAQSCSAYKRKLNKLKPVKPIKPIRSS